MRRILVVFIAVLSLSGCATRGALEQEIFDRKAVVNTVHMKVIECRDEARTDRDFFARELDKMDARIKALADSMLGAWDREECERYTPEAQKLFCHRLPRYVEYGPAPKVPNRFKSASKKAAQMTDEEFEQVLNEARRETDKKFEQNLKRDLESIKGLAPR